MTCGVVRETHPVVETKFACRLHGAASRKHKSTTRNSQWSHAKARGSVKGEKGREKERGREYRDFCMDEEDYGLPRFAVAMATASPIPIVGTLPVGAEPSGFTGPSAYDT